MRFRFPFKRTTGLTATQWRLGGEQLSQAPLPIAEYAFDIASHKQPLNQRPAARAIPNMVQAGGAAVALFEGVRMMPERIWAAELHIHELVRRIPLGDFRAPPDGNPTHTDAVVDERTRTHRDGCRGQHVETQPGRCDGLQVVRVREKCENLVPQTWQPQFGVESEFFHRWRALVTALS